MDLEPVSRTILVVDIEKSSDRTDPEKAALRSALYGVLHGALDAAGLTADRRRIDDTGDGVLVVADSEVLPMLDPFLDDAVEALARHNALVSPTEWLRLRFAVHFGLVARDGQGWVGDDVTTTFRINNSTLVKDSLRAADRAQSVVVVSDAVYRSVVRHRHRNLRPEVYREQHDDGRTFWVRVPGYAEPPVPAAHTSPRPPAAADGPVAGKSITISHNGHGNVFATDTIHHVDARTGFREQP
ncbi:hypothetical protein [Umezawaea tangerina]|uniref:Class 3 adenylate cyclase n=1 Tax=Umezawaea tangerina TaxID=84725 RepID=A0A2T0SLG7_9PSEU|nr:hypothetical protein [Umezawaea tangerina]PRY34257.1 class 3 adenylate cyclase [Umezawaea tangerina]